MSIVTVDIPDSLMRSIVELAAQEGYSLEQFLASAAGEKLAVLLTANYLKCEAQAGRREDFDRYLSAVPDVPAPEWDRMS